jgi:phosphoribosylglycinamide formyltransferase 1
MGRRVGVLISGAGSNLQALIDAGIQVAAVASNEPDAAGLDRARRAGLAGYMHLLQRTFLDRFPDAIVNVHPSLLPVFPGAHAVEDALAAGVDETGATVHLIDEGVDTGTVLRQERVPVLVGDTAETLHARIKEVEHRILPEVVKDLVRA